MQLNRCLLLILMCLMLAACACTKMAQDLQAGKASFESGHYKKAFHQLLPLAVKCRAEAQYAVGYMYYYGYGVSEDTESGIFWMTKAAEQNYQPACKALELLQHPPPPAEYQSVIPVDQSSPYENHRERVLGGEQQYIPVTTHSRPKRVAYVEEKESPAEPPVKIASSQEEKQVPHQEEPARKYALQLYGSYHLSAVKDLQLQLQLKNTGHIYQTTHEGKDWYVLTFGNFVTASEASATQKNLPGGLKEMHPWVRNVNELHLI